MVEEVQLTFNGVRKRYKRARGIEIESMDMLVYFEGYRDHFKHYWTLKDIEDLDELKNEKDKTKTYARERLKDYLEKSPMGDPEKIWNEWVSELRVEFEKPDKLERFTEFKKELPELDKAIKDISEIEQKRPDRIKEFQTNLKNISDNLKEYNKNLDKARQNIKFEEETKGRFKAGKSKRTPTEWYDEEGNKHQYIIFPGRVSHIFWTEKGERMTVDFPSKQKAKEYYKENRIG